MVLSTSFDSIMAVFAVWLTFLGILCRLNHDAFIIDGFPTILVSDCTLEETVWVLSGNG